MLDVQTFTTVDEAAAAMTPQSRFLGGGTLIMNRVNYGDQRFNRILRTTDASLKRIGSEGDSIVIGAGATMNEITQSADSSFLAPAARAVGGPAIRNMATVGGNLMAPHPYGDFAVALLALDARLRMVGGEEISLEDFLARRSGLVQAVLLRRPQGDAFRFRKVSRVKPKGVSVMSMAVYLGRSAGRLSGVRVAYGAMGPTPVRVRAVEAALEGASLDAVGIAPALAVATEGLEPPDDPLASAWYRREVAPVHLRRLLIGEAAQ
ncbi:MAG: xanthine dehydrogenase family protein subunit M [Arenibacterium sp.]